MPRCSNTATQSEVIKVGCAARGPRSDCGSKNVSAIGQTSVSRWAANSSSVAINMKKTDHALCEREDILEQFRLAAQLFHIVLNCTERF